MATENTKVHYVKPAREDIIVMARGAASENTASKLPNGFGCLVVGYINGFNACDKIRDKQENQLKEDNKILRRSFDNLRAEVINILSRGKGYTISGDEYDRLQNAANPINILSPSNIETNANGE